MQSTGADTIREAMLVVRTRLALNALLAARDQVPVDRVALGRCRPGAPTDPYVRTLAHTVPQFMGSLHGCPCTLS